MLARKRAGGLPAGLSCAQLGWGVLAARAGLAATAALPRIRARQSAQARAGAWPCPFFVALSNACLRTAVIRRFPAECIVVSPAVDSTPHLVVMAVIVLPTAP